MIDVQCDFVRGVVGFYISQSSWYLFKPGAKLKVPVFHCR